VDFGSPQIYFYKNKTKGRQKYKLNTIKMFNYYLEVLEKYAVFTGRASRAEYWYFFLFSLIIALGLIFIEGLLRARYYHIGGGRLIDLYFLATFIPSVAVSIRRMHDVNKSGWYILVPIYGFILTLIKGTEGDNNYGLDPKASE